MLHTQEQKEKQIKTKPNYCINNQRKTTKKTINREVALRKDALSAYAITYTPTVQWFFDVRQHF